MADRWYPKLFKATNQSLKQSVRTVSNRLNISTANISEADIANWTASLIGAKSKNMYAMTENGYGLLSDEIGNLQKWTNLAGVDKHIEQTSRLESETTAKIMDRISTRVDTLTDDDGKPLSGPTKARIVQAEGYARMTTRASMSARTASMWSYNQGAQEAYKDFGVNTIDWLATEDDLTCDYCMDMDALEPIPIENNFFNPGDEMQIPDVGTLNFPIEIEHPPLHPNCRCTIIGVV